MASLQFTNSEQSRSGEQRSQPCRAVQMKKLKLEVLTMVSDFLENRPRKKVRGNCITLSDLNERWQIRHQYSKFVDYGFGTFRSFLVNNCNLKQPIEQRGSEMLQITLKDVETELERIKANGGVSYPPAGDLANHTNRPKNNAAEKEAIEGAVQNADPPESASLLMDRSVHEKTLSVPDKTGNGLSKEETNFISVVTILYKCALDVLRGTFQRIHPKWSNSERDIATFEKGNLHIHPYQEPIFSTGDIEQWDITLMCSVLIYSKVSKQKLDEEQEFKGYKGAIENIREIRNKIQSHRASMKLPENEYNLLVKTLNSAVIKLGCSEQEFQATLQNVVFTGDKFYLEMFHEEVKRMRNEQRSGFEELKEGHKVTNEKLEQVLARITEKNVWQGEISGKIQSQPGCDEWLQVKRRMKNFDVDNNQYILIVDKLLAVDQDHVKNLAILPWKLVVDLDPESDVRGFLSTFGVNEANGGIIEKFTPSKIRDNNVDKHIDAKRTQWLFANGRNFEEEDNVAGDQQRCNENKSRDTFVDWKRNFKCPVHDLIRGCSKKLDEMKPTFCIVLSIRSGVNMEIAQEIMNEIDSIFAYNYSMSYLSFAPELDITDFANATYTDLSLNLFLIGLASILGIRDGKYALPSGQYKLPVTLTPIQYNYLSEYLEILYEGCEDIPKELSEEEKESFEHEHLRKFLTGNAITFPSLYFRHDATRSLTNEINIRIRQLQERIQKPQIIQITHAPGSGGTTIARRLLWELHRALPCAIVKLDLGPENIGQESDGERYVKNLCERISIIENTCEKSPVILIDGNSRLVRIISDCVVRKLDGRAFILRCMHYDKTTGMLQGEDDIRPIEADSKNLHEENESNSTEKHDSFFSTENNFNVKANLKDEDGAYFEFKAKYDKYCAIFPQKDGSGSGRKRERVFHFPMMAMLGEFKLLRSIVKSSLDILKTDQPLEYEVAILVAFLQLYSDRATPASLITKYCHKNSKTYREVTAQFSETLVNLMVPEKARSKEKFIAYKRAEIEYFNYDDDDCSSLPQNIDHVIKLYSFQHENIAKLVLEHSERGIDQITQDFVDTKILEGYKKDNENKSLIDDLFLYKKRSEETHFSVLVLQLAKGLNCGRILEEVARQTKDVTFYSHVARFFAYFKSDCEKARQLIKEGFEADNDAPIEKKRGVYSTEGHIVLMGMKNKGAKVRDFDCLKIHSSEALDLFKQARGNPPLTYPNPLIGEVMVWQFCFEWIIKSKENDAEAGIKFILQDNFFAGAIPECIYLLDQVDQIVQTVPTLYNPGHTRQLAKERRLQLMQTIGRSRSNTKRKGWCAVNIFRLCDEIISKYKKTASEKDITRLRALWLLDQADRKIHRLDRVEKENLLGLLEKLVRKYNMFIHTRELMEVAAEQLKPPFDTDQALQIIENWQRSLPNDPFSYFYQYVFCFMKVRGTAVFDYRATYENAMEACAKKTQGNFRKYSPQFFMGKDGKEICKLFSRAKLESKFSPTYKCANKDTDSRRNEDVLDQVFWDNHSRDYLLECKGRVECTQKNFRGERRPYIIMEPGNIRIGVPRNSIGTAYVDYQPDSRVSFVVCFTLSGPKARGIKFLDSTGKSSSSHSKYSRQGSKSERK